jgi:hypothetical protein
MGALPYALQVLSILPSLIQAGMDVTALVQNSTAALNKMQDEKRDPTPEEWHALNAQIKMLRGELHAPGA